MFMLTMVLVTCVKSSVHCHHSHFKVDLPGPTLDGAPRDWICWFSASPEVQVVGAILMDLGGDASDGICLGIQVFVNG